MTYIFKNTEINNEKATVFETKSLLYLIGKRNDSKEIEYVTFDCFNDVSGINKRHNKIWDIQSKNEASLSPKKIGTYFFTLFDNFSSTFAFKEFIFFCPILKDDYKIDSSLRSYNFDNIVEKTKTRIKNGLTEEVIRVKKDSIDYTSQIELFLDIVTIVEDDQAENEYIKAITKFKKTEIKSDDFYKSVFIDLRNIQSSKKISYIENATITEIREVLSFKRHLSVKDIELLIVSRIIGTEIFKNIFYYPLYFSIFIDHLNIEDKKDVLQDCNSNLSRAFFNKNSNKVFWKVCEDIITYFSLNNNKDADLVYNTVFGSYTPRISFLNEITIKYLISIIIEGIE
ncbi:hypothetical protein LPB87_16525 [Flavobacterium sp. EDS]|uniref:hypothetical protein n=1 Tax=Flavobacterium sp. EDS TaxID=2897328 RepID=UPI001E541424|nr:hypothetical protein [Flavobacterium sp. EDS]MCD0476004.1 hypothetical protein [Flavobacterium sp. EDS]